MTNLKTQKLTKQGKKAPKKVETVEHFLKKGGKIKEYDKKGKLIKINILANTIIDAVKPKNEEKKTMTTKLEMTQGFVVSSTDAKLAIGNNRKVKTAVEGVVGVKAVEAIEAVKAVKANKKEGIEAVKAVKAVKAVVGVKAVEAKSAVPATQFVHLDCATEAVMNEVRARMADQGFADEFEGQIIMHKDLFRLTYAAETDKPIRAAFKACKSKDGYNKAGLDALTAEEKVKKVKEEPKKSEKKVEEIPAPEKKEDEDVVWPGETFDE